MQFVMLSESCKKQQKCLDIRLSLSFSEIWSRKLISNCLRSNKNVQVVHSKNKSYITSNILLQKGRVRAITDISFKVYLIRRNKRWKNQAKTATKYIVWHRAVLYKLCTRKTFQLKLIFLILLLSIEISFD